ncbi:hypothetical protein FZEAL_8908 [Fusarium zealandicum]|uniref:Uncharacterized protein n=1 Tax=Fusarium zealandicum TaxID=1053134 RepID=A0A8H4XGE1_9HYPO|nr:hypothetical protein FZEAL_8908 [Fusarium zealandicum]
MPSSPPPQTDNENHLGQDGNIPIVGEEAIMSNSHRAPHTKTKTPEPHGEQQASPGTPDTPGVLEPFDWDEFEARYEAALHDADEHDREIMKQAEALSKYFKVWASAASSHDDERAAKRLQTRRRYVNLSEQKMEQKQEHYDHVVRAFENALALLKSHLPSLCITLVKVQDMPQPNVVSGQVEYGIPNVSKDDLFAFHEAHFSQASLSSFGSSFVHPTSLQPDQTDAHYDAWDEQDDGLGYYPDGVKRTLTDEQIEIFRHSEREALRKQQEKQRGSRTAASSDDAMDMSDDGPTAHSESTSSAPPVSFESNKKRKKKKAPKRGRPEPKPDLRKRTWDVVDKGLDTLDYD